MSFSEERGWLLSYDIAEPKRLVKLHRYLKGQGVAVQYSVFAAMLSERRMVGVESGIEHRIEGRRDDVRVYPLPERCEAVLLGRRTFPEGILLPVRRMVELLGSGALLPKREAALEAGEDDD